MDFTIIGIAYGEDPPAWPRGGTPSITSFFGDPLYTHAMSDGAKGVTLTIDQKPISTSQATGPITKIALNYKPRIDGEPEQHMIWDNPGVTYNGNLLDLHLQLLGGEDTGDVVLVVTERVDKPVVDDLGCFGLIVIGPTVDASAAPRAYFVDVPVGHTLKATSARVKFPRKGGISGPIGSVNVP